MSLEEKILDLFQKKEGIDTSNLIVSLPDDFDESYSCEIMEQEDNGKVWTIQLNSKLTRIVDIYEL